MTHHFQVISRHLPPHFLRATINRPWMRMFIFLDEGPLSRTPEHYKKFVYDWKCVTPTPVHYIPEPGLWKKSEDGLVVPVHNIPIPLKYPIEMNEGLWGGEAIVKGFKIKNKKKADPLPDYWAPKIEETVVYSEVLNKYMRTIVTNRALELIDQNYGLDFYLLKTPPCDLMSVLAFKLKREILYTLLHKTMYPDDPVKREEVYEKYKEFLIPEEEIEWFGLTLAEAYRKQSKIEEQQKKVGPYKHIFRKEFIEQLKAAAIREQESTEEEQKKTLLQKLSSLSLFKKEK